MNAIHRHRKARQDLVDIFRYYAREAGLRVAQRFLAQVEATPPFLQRNSVWVRMPTRNRTKAETVGCDILL